MIIQTKFPPKNDVSRRALLTGGLAGGFLLAFHLPVRAAFNEPVQPPDATAGKFAPNAFIRIDEAGHTTLVMPQVEMGQGVYTSIAMVLAEELDADFSKVVLLARAAGRQALRQPGLRPAGDRQLQLDPGVVEAAAHRRRQRACDAGADGGRAMAGGARELYDLEGRSHAQRQRTKTLLWRASACCREPDAAQGRPAQGPQDFVYIGQSLKRLDTPDKVNGKAVYGIDAMLPGMKFATLAACPVFGGKVGKVDDSAAKKIPGVHKIVVLDDLVAVVGDHMWAAKKGLEALRIDWDEGPNAKIGSRDIWQHLRAASEKDGAVAKSVGDIAKGLSSGDKFEATFELPFLAHASMEPINATVHVKPDSCEIWTGTQVVTRVQSEAAKAAGLPVEKVIVNNHLLGGGFGRKLEPDMVIAAVRIAKQVDYPVKVVWTREEDIQHDVYRPVYRDSIAATLVDGKVAAWKYKVTGSSILARWLPPAFQNGIDIDAVDAAIDMPYDIPNFHVEYVQAEPPAVPTGFWRGVGPNNNVFAVECSMDELARKASKDPVEFRRAMLASKPRAVAVLNLAAEKSNWGQPLPARVGRGVCLQPSFATFIATVVEAEVDQQGEVLLRRIISVVDTGIAVNPDTVKAQLEGGLIFGLTAALYGEITIDKGRVQQSNFHDYRMLRIDQTPKIEVHVVKSGEPPGGIGETGANAGPPALRNAIYAATGVALRRLPIDRSLLAVGKKA